MYAYYNGAEMGSQTNSKVRLAHCVFMTEFATEADAACALAEPLLGYARRRH